jgi:DNA-binding HxlR family transcriptional regulator
MKLQKITNESEAARRRYDDACGTAHALELIGERWALLVVRELMLGPKRFTDLRGDLPGISANVLTQRLESLEAAGIVVKRKLAPPASVQVYELTPWGYESEPIFQTLGRWAARSPGHDPSLPLSAVSLMLSFRTMFDAKRAGGLNARIGFRMGAESYLVRIEDGTLTAQRDPLNQTDVIFTGPPTVIAAAVYGGAPLEALDALTVEGDQALAQRFTSFFPLPPKVGAA